MRSSFICIHTTGSQQAPANAATEISLSAENNKPHHAPHSRGSASLIGMRTNASATSSN